MIRKYSLLLSLLIALCCLSSCKTNLPPTLGVSSDHSSDVTFPPMTDASGNTAVPEETVRDAVTNPPHSDPVTNDSIIPSDGAATVKFNNTFAECTGNGVTAEGSTVTVTCAGEYFFSGNTENGRIIVNAKKTDKIKLIFNGISISCTDSAPIWIMSADKTTIELADGSINILGDGAEYKDQNSESEPNAALFSKDDLTITGTGSLTVNASFNNGITSKNDLKIKSGIITISAKHDGLRGKDSVEISGGAVTINCDGDGIKSYETEQDGKGIISLSGGEINITAGQDGIQSDMSCTVDGSIISLKTGGGSANSSDKEGWGDWGRPGRYDYTDSSSDTSSAKGIKASQLLEIKNGSIIVDSSDDSIHSNENIIISGGAISLTSGDDGIHADTELNISGGKIDIFKSYEGIEASVINISGGTTNIMASDDGLNAAGGNDGSAMGGRPGMGGFSSGVGELNITGGYLYMNAGGDGLDSNGTVVLSGGTVLVDGPENSGNGPLDYDRSFTVTGGELIAVGSAGMAQNVSRSSQAAVLVGVSGTGGQKISLKDKSGNIILSHTPAKRFDCVLFCHSSLKQGEEYTVVLDNDTVQTFTLTETIMSVGVQGGMGGPGGRPTRPW